MEQASLDRVWLGEAQKVFQDTVQPVDFPDQDVGKFQFRVVFGNTISQNLVSGNHNIGMLIGSDGNVIEENLIGTDASGNFDLGNGSDGVMLLGSSNLVLANLVSGNDGNGVTIQEAGENNLVVGNLIGTDLSGAVAVPNFNGVLVSGPSNVIGVDASGNGEGNLISGNTASGVNLSGPASTGNSVAGNAIGTDLTGAASVTSKRKSCLYRLADSRKTPPQIPICCKL